MVCHCRLDHQYHRTGSVNGSFSEPWSEQAESGKAVFWVHSCSTSCLTVLLGSGPNAPQVTLLLYADDLVILADNPSDLQNALNAGVWGSQWRFSFGIGPDKTAVLVVSSRSSNFRFHLQGGPVPLSVEIRPLFSRAHMHVAGA